MNNKRDQVQTMRHRTFVPQLRERRDRIVYQGRIGAIGASPRSRYQLVAFSAVASLLLLIVSSLIHPALSTGVGLLVVGLVAGGWPAATGVAELRRVKRVYSHSIIIVLAGLISVMVAFAEDGVQRLNFVPAVAVVGIVASFMVELIRGEGAIGRLESVISCISGVLAAVSVSGWTAMAELFQHSRESYPILVVGLIFALIIGVFGIRLISAGPREGPRRGAITLGVTPTAFVGVIGYVIAIFLTPMLS